MAQSQQIPLVQPSADEQFGQAWHAWVSHSARGGRIPRRSSQAVYGHMWTAFATWAAQRGAGPGDLTPAHLADYLTQRGEGDDMSRRYAWRLVRLVERVLALAHAQGRLAPNTACAEFMARRPDVRFANASQQDELPDALSAAEAVLLVKWLKTSTPSSSVATAQEWKALRLRAAVGLQLGAGLTPGEIRALALPHIGWDEASGGHRSIRANPRAAKLLLPANGNAAGHTAMLTAWPARLLHQWLQLRSELNIPGSMVFPATRSKGAPWGKVAHYEAVRKALQDAGITRQDGGSYCLRHTYALRQLSRGIAGPQLARQLGISDPDVIERYQRLLQQRAESQVDEFENSYNARLDAW